MSNHFEACQGCYRACDILVIEMKGMDSLHITGHCETPRKVPVFMLDGMIRNHYSLTEIPSYVYDQRATTGTGGVYQ
jgi:hypothetical protein